MRRLVTALLRVAIIAAAGVFFALCSLFFLFFQMLHPTWFPWYHDDEFTLMINNNEDQELYIESVHFDEWSTKKPISLQPEHSNGKNNIRHIRYLFGDAPYGKTANISLSYTYNINTPAITLEQKIDRSKFWSCMFIIKINKNRASISECMANPTTDFD
jgi:hypothetical protein